MSRTARYDLVVPVGHALASESEEQMTALTREYRGDGEYTSVHHPDTPGDGAGSGGRHSFRLTSITGANDVC